MSKIEKIVADADYAYNNGCNCSEAVTTAFYQNFPEQLCDCIIPMSSNFGGGIASGCICGALAGSTMVIGALAGRKTPTDKPKDEVNALSKEFFALASATFAQPCCKEIKAGPLGATGEYKNCTRVVRNASQLLANFLANKGLIKL